MDERKREARKAKEARGSCRSLMVGGLAERRGPVCKQMGDNKVRAGGVGKGRPPSPAHLHRLELLLPPALLIPSR